MWVALDDITDDNGGLLVVPKSHTCLQNDTGDPTTQSYAPLPCSLEEGAAAVAEGQCVYMKIHAGDAVVMHDRLLHCSMPNASRSRRKAWMPQFSALPIARREKEGPGGHAVPLFF